MELSEKILLGMACCLPETDEDAELGCSKCPYNDDRCGDANQDVMLRTAIIEDIRSLLKAQEASIMTPEKVAVLQGFLLDIPSSESILNSVNCHAISLEDASRIIAICACACDVMSPSGFIRWLKERLMNDYILKECIKE